MNNKRTSLYPKHMEDYFDKGFQRTSGVPTILPKKGHLQQVAQDHVQLAFEDLQGARLHRFSGKPVSMLHHPHSKVFPDTQRERPVFEFDPIVSCCVTMEKRLAPFSSFHPPFRCLYKLMRSLLSLPFTVLNFSISLCLSSQDRCFSPSSCLFVQ